MKSAITLLLVLSSLGATRLDVHGRVSTQDGQPIPNATAYVYTAAVKVGTSAFCPSCYPDCGKTAGTDAQGNFKILSLDSQLKFRVLFIAEGYKPAIVPDVDPASESPVEAKLAPAPQITDPARMLKGTVIGPDGQPVLGAIVEPFGCQTAERRWWGSMPGVDPMSITNARGEFILASDQPAIAYDLRIEARGLAKRNFTLVPLGAKSQELQLGEGATVTGRLLKDGKPVAGATIGLVQENRGAGYFVGAQKIGTDADGRFTFLNVGPAGNWFVYGMMDDASAHGTVRIQTVNVLGNNTVSDAGDLTSGPSYTIKGQVVLSDGRPIPANTRLALGRHDAWDSQSVKLDADGRFVLKGVPKESVHVSVSVKGYHLSRDNFSLDLLNLTFLAGVVDRDIPDLKIKLDPGPIERSDPALHQADGARSFQLSKTPLDGVH